MNSSLNITRQYLKLNRNLKHNFQRNKSSSTAQYCLESVKRYDYENFICTLLLKNTTRSCAIAVRSFNVEVARVGEQVSDSKIGAMRLQFWEDTINSCFNTNTTKIPQHPVAAELYKTITRYKLNKRYFNNLIISRRENLLGNGFKSMQDLEKYSELSVSSVYYLILEGSGIQNVNADHAASHLGKAQGIVQQLRNIALASKLNVIPIPQDILIKNKVSQEEVLRGISSEKLNDCTYEVASTAYQHLMKARSLSKDVPSQARGILLPAVVIGNYLEKLQNLNYDVLNPILQKRSWTWLPKLWYAHFRNRF